MQLFYPNIGWNLFQKNLFRFFFVYVLLNIFPFPLDTIVFFIPITEYYYSFLDTLVPFFGHTLLGFSNDFNFDFEPSGSGDKAIHYVYQFIFLVVSLLVAAVWAVADKKRTSYDTLFHYFLIACRYYLGVTLLSYGWEKVFHLQMPHIGLHHLLMPIGEQSPMGLAWRFVGFSDAYSSFSGWAEVIPGILLFFRRTTLIGALCSFAVMLNVMIMNYAYDIPVKLYSTFLALLSIIIISPNLKRLLDIFIFHKAVGDVEYKPLFVARGWKITRIAVKGIMLLLGIGFSFYSAYAATEEYGADVKPPLYGIYKTEKFIRNRGTIALYSDSTIWKNIVFNWEGRTIVNKFSDKRMPCFSKVDTLKKTFELKPMGDTTLVYTFRYQQLNDTTYKFSGVSRKDTLEMVCRRLDRNNFTLYKTGFHWVNETPNNR